MVVSMDAQRSDVWDGVLLDFYILRVIPNIELNLCFKIIRGNETD